MSSTLQRVLGGLGLVVAGVLSLPIAAAILDGPSTENWIIPVQLLVMAGIGAGLGVVLPGLVGADASTSRRALTGAVLGVVAGLIGLIVFWFLLNGFDGA